MGSIGLRFLRIKGRHRRGFPQDLIGVACALFILSGCGSGGGEGATCQAVGGIAVSGTAQFEKSIPNMSVPERPILVIAPIRHAEVQVQNASGQVVARTATDAGGRYCAIFPGSENPGLGKVSLFSRTLGRLDSSIQDIRVARLSPIYEEKELAATFDERHGTEFIVNFQERQQAGFFNILDAAIRGSQFIQNMSGTTPGRLTLFWQSGVPGTFFVTAEGCVAEVGINTPCINVEGPVDFFFGDIFGDDADEFDDDIILHEFGHFVSHEFSKDSSRGGIHFLNDHSQDVRLAWSEGWATFFSSAVRNNPVNTNAWPLGIKFSFSIEDNRLLVDDNNIFSPEDGDIGDETIYTTNEISVASVLWDIFDGIGEGFDLLSLGFGPIWDVLSFWKMTETLPPITMEAFWDSFGQVEPAFVNIARDRRMEFDPDAFEFSNSSCPNRDDNCPDPDRLINLGVLERHTLFPDGDIDYIAFSAEAGKQYIVETSGLRNGTDTFLEILDPGGQTLLASNDNADNRAYTDLCNSWTPVCLQTGPNGECLDSRIQPRSWPSPSCPNGQPAAFLLGFSMTGDNRDNPLWSRIVLSASSTGTYYAKVSRSPNRPPSAGRFGSYDFRITEVIP